jgi:hypothetical protein
VVRVLGLTPVSTLTTLTAAPGTTAPEGSTTVPTILPPSLACARRSLVEIGAMHNATQTTTRRRSILIVASYALARAS